MGVQTIVMATGSVLFGFVHMFRRQPLSLFASDSRFRAATRLFGSGGLGWVDWHIAGQRPLRGCLMHCCCHNGLLEVSGPIS